jgi:hypothetical protein
LVPAGVGLAAAELADVELAEAEFGVGDAGGGVGVGEVEVGSEATTSTICEANALPQWLEHWAVTSSGPGWMSAGIVADSVKLPADMVTEPRGTRSLPAVSAFSVTTEPSIAASGPAESDGLGSGAVHASKPLPLMTTFPPGSMLDGETTITGP